MTASLPGDEAFQIANVIKYVSRYRDKDGGAKAVEDLRKARNYLDMLIEHILRKGVTGTAAIISVSRDEEFRRLLIDQVDSFAAGGSAIPVYDAYPRKGDT